MSRQDKSLARAVAAEPEPSLAEEAEERREVDAWRVHKKTEAADFAGARVKNGWAVGSLLTETEYDDGIKAYRQIGLRLWRYRALRPPSGERAWGS